MKRIFLNDYLIFGLILLNSFILFLMSFPGLPFMDLLIWIDTGLTLFFVMEMGYKLHHYSAKEFLSEGWNIFDLVIVAISAPALFSPLIDHGEAFTFVLLLRLLRVTRAFRLMRFVPKIDKVIAGLKRAFKASAFVFFGLMIYNFLLSVLTCQLFGDTAPEYFGNPLISAYSIFRIFTIEGWNEIPDTIAANSNGFTGAVARIYFVAVVLTGGIFGFSIVNAIFVDEMTHDNTDELEESVEQLNQKVDSLTQKLDKMNALLEENNPGAGPQG